MRDDEKMEEMQDMFSDILSEAAPVEAMESTEIVDESPIEAETLEEITEVPAMDTEETDSKKKKVKKKAKKSKEEIKADVDSKILQLKSVKVRMLRSYIFVIVISLVASVAGLLLLSMTGRQLSVFYNSNYMITNKVWDAKYAQLQARNELMCAMLEEDFKIVKENKLNSIEQLKQVRDMVEGLRQYDTVDGAIIDKIESLIDAANTYIDDMDEHITFGHGKEAYKVMKEKYIPAVDEIEGLLGQIADHESELAKQKVDQVGQIMIIAALIVIVIATISIIVAMALGRKMSKQICDPVEEIEKAAKKLASGDLNVEINYYATDELGVLADNMRASCEFLKKIIADSDKVLGAMAGGDFTVESEDESYYIGDFSGLLTSMQELKTQMQNTLVEINNAADQVSMSSGQIADSSQALAEGATEQAGAVQELTAMINGVTETAKETAGIANNSHELAMASIEEAKIGMQKMDELLSAMAAISSSSKRIEEIITEIENIADQTSLLSLNASIEAARAGEAGRGFAVVADQIGKLAGDSSQSVENTRNMIQASLDQIEKGNVITESTSEEIKKIMESIYKLADSMKDVNAKVASQTDAISRVESGIEQITTVIESNSAAAEESAAISQEFAAQADMLKGLIEKFQL